MNISEEELREMIRAAVSRATREPRSEGETHAASHTSHARLSLVGGGDPDGQCLIEPAVRCNHCGYCQSLGH